MVGPQWTPVPLNGNDGPRRAETTLQATMPAEESNPFVCNVCKRSYSRVDHLARHYRSHTHEKPFPCLTCGKDFARADLLKRHASSHNVDSGGKKRQRMSSPVQPSRVSQACTACAAAKLKCGQEKPCRRCQRKGIACTSPPTSERRRNGSPPLPVEDSLQEPFGSDRTTQSMPFRDMAEDSLNPSIQTSATSLFSQAPPIPSMSLEEDSPLDLDDSSLADFLRDVMVQASPNAVAPARAPDSMFQSYNPRDVLDFGFETSLDLDEVDFGLISSYNEKAPLVNLNMVEDNFDKALESGQGTPDLQGGISLGIEAFKKSLWRWTPAQQDHGYAEQLNLSVPHKDMNSLETRLTADGFDHRLEQSSRDRILAMLLSTCEPANIPRVASSFPSTELLENLMDTFFKSQVSQTDSWIHLPTFRPIAQRPEFNGVIIAAGAVLSPVSTVRKLGFAIQEAVRLAIPSVFEKDNSTTRELQILQAYALQLSIGLWSGNKRKMEIAESHAQPLVTMLRRAGHYRRARLTVPSPERGDDSKTLEVKWRQWVEAESFKRLAFHTLVHDAQTSLALLVPPLISYSEMSLELPSSRALWLARTADSWRDIYLATFPGPPTRMPSLAHCIDDVLPLAKVQDQVDLPMSTFIILHGLWGLISEYRQLDTVLKLQSANQRWNGALISTSWHQELCRLLSHLRMTFSEWNGGMQPEVVLIQELFMMNLHVSFEELQLFAGKEGDEEARRVYPFLRQWIESRESRQAVWHAGQIIRAATTCRPNQLRDVYAIALYHASLAFWAYGMLSLASKQRRRQSISSHSSTMGNELVWLDSEDTADSVDTRRFISLQRGVPVIHDWPKYSEQPDKHVPLDDPKAVVEVVIEILRRNCSTESKVLPPLVENLSQLMRDLGNAARVIGRR